MDLTSDELGVLEARNETQDARLIAPFDLSLKTHEAVVIPGQIVLPQLDRGIGLLARPRIDETDRLHRPEAQRVDAPVRHDLDRQTALEESLAVEIVNGRRLCVHERIVKPRVFVTGQRAVQVVAAAVVDSACGRSPYGGARSARSTVRRPGRLRLRYQRADERPGFGSMVSASTIGLIAS